MTDDAQTADDWLSNPSPPPRALGTPAHQAPKGKARPRPDLKPVTRLADIAHQLQDAPVAAEPEGQPDDPGPRSADPEPDQAPPDPGKGAAPPRRGARPKGEIWEGCPVKPLGVNGEVSYYLDRHGQLRGIKKHENQTILHLFGDKLDLLIRKYPTYAKGSTEPQKHRFDGTRASMDMIRACSEKGLFNPDGAVRGVGAWVDDEGRLIYHTGQALITAEGSKDPGEIDGKVYPAYPPIPAPSLTGGTGCPATDMLGTLSTWSWARPDVDPMITLGMTAVQMMCGALTWRPAYWFTGDKASGKSALQDWIRFIHGERGIVRSTDATKSGITSQIGHSSLPVAIDELEPGDEGSSKERDIIVLARVASSGGQWLRGSADQKGASGNVYSAFMFSSILIPGSMGAQDRSRLITLNMNPIPPGQAKPVMTARTWNARGAALKRRLIDRWPSWAERLELWRVALAEHNLAGRNGDNWATTIAMADMALNAELPTPEFMAQWALKLSFAAQTETDEIGSNAEDMLQHLIGQPFDVFRRGELFNVAHWLMTAASLPAAPRELVLGANDTGGVIDEHVRAEAAKRANEKLAKVGLRVKGDGDGAELFIPNKPIPGLMRLFEHSQWARGVWAQAARRVPGAQLVANPLRLAGQATRGVYVPFRSISGLLSFPMDRAAPVAPPAPDGFEDFA